MSQVFRYRIRQKRKSRGLRQAPDTVILVGIGCSRMRSGGLPGREAGLTLIEILAVIGILAILATLLLGPVQKAYVKSKDIAWRSESAGFVSLIEERLIPFYRSQTHYPAWSADDLYGRGVFDDRIMEFLRSPNVTFTPFSSTDPDDRTILLVTGKSVTGNWFILLSKESVTKPE